MTAVLKNCISGPAYIKAASDQAFGVVAEAAAWAAVYSGLSLWRRFSADSAASIQQDLSSRKVALAEAALAHAQLTWEKESAFVTETMGTASFDPSYSSVPAVGGIVDSEARNVMSELDKIALKTGLPLSDTDDIRTARALATARTDLTSHTMRAAEARAIQLNDRRYSRQYAVLGLGKGVLRNAYSMGQLGGGQEVVSNAIGYAIDSGFALWGYASNRVERGPGWTNAPQNAPRVLQRGQSMYEVDYGNSSQKANIFINTNIGAGAQTALGEG
jgi:hypothetical protein